MIVIYQVYLCNESCILFPGSILQDKREGTYLNCEDTCFTLMGYKSQHRIQVNSYNTK